jgi:peptidoglycan/xylan/chitin deacetylase (PgdA/CDA1 family)
MTACLMLHGIGPVPSHIPDVEKPYWLPVDLFADVVEMVRGGDARFTFDDGNATDVSIALPALRAAGLTAAFFIPSDRIGRPGYLGEDDIRRLHNEGMEIGSHGCAHMRWTEVCDAEIANDVMHSIERLAGIVQAPVRSVAIPYGHCDRRVLGILRRLGIARVYSSFRGPEADGAWLVRRDCIMAHMSRGEIHEILTRSPARTQAALAFLRIWRRAGNAVLRKA